MSWRQYFVNPRQTMLRKVAFQVHLWVGLGLGSYMVLMSLTGITMVFDDEIVAMAHPEWVYVKDRGDGKGVMKALMASMKATFPDHKIFRIYAPSARRDTYAVLAERNGSFVTAFVHPATGAVVGTKQVPNFMRLVRGLHANLLGAGTGRRVNCTIALVVLLLPITGVIIWWPGIKRWWSALVVTRRSAPAFARSLHGAVGVWTFAFIAMFASTGALYYYGPAFYRALAIVSMRTSQPSPHSDPTLAGTRPRPDIDQLIARAQEPPPSLPLHAVSPPSSDKSPWQIQLGPERNVLGADLWTWDSTGYRHVYFDQYSGDLLAQWDVTNPTLADHLQKWAVPLHRGNFDGTLAKGLWALVGFAPTLLFILALWMWWRRVVRRKTALTER